MKRSTRRIIRDYGGTTLVAVGIALLVRNFVLEAYRVPSVAMKPTLLSGDTIFVAKWPFLIQKRTPERGDVVVFSVPPENDSPKLNYIKRVVGLPGDQIAIHQGLIILNGKKLSEHLEAKLPCSMEKLPGGRTYQVCKDAPLMEDFGPEKVPDGSAFVIGDLRSQPDKKRKPWKLVPLSAIKGQALWIWLSIQPGDSLGSEGVFRFLPHFRFDRMFRRIN